MASFARQYWPACSDWNRSMRSMVGSTAPLQWPGRRSSQTCLIPNASLGRSFHELSICKVWNGTCPQEVTPCGQEVILKGSSISDVCNASPQCETAVRTVIGVDSLVLMVSVVPVSVGTSFTGFTVIVTVTGADHAPALSCAR